MLSSDNMCKCSIAFDGLQIATTQNKRRPPNLVFLVFPYLSHAGAHKMNPVFALVRNQPIQQVGQMTGCL